jgi:putative addiction module component (TIGR02574 family)
LKARRPFEEVLCAALALPPDERALLIDELLASLEASQEEIDAAWAQEIEKRIRDLDEGRVEAIDGELVMQRLRSRRELNSRRFGNDPLR